MVLDAYVDAFAPKFFTYSFIDDLVVIEYFRYILLLSFFSLKS